jgi:hypothetical protein
MTTNERTAGRYLRWLLAAFSLGAGVIHLAVSGENYQLSWMHGMFFVVVGWLQISWAVAVILRPKRRLLTVGVLLNAGIIGVWVMSRVWGVPVGPEAWTPESVALADALSSGCEFGIVALSLAVLVQPAMAQHELRPRFAVPVVGAAGLGVAVVAALALTTGYGLSPQYAAANDHAAHSAHGSHSGHGPTVEVVNGKAKVVTSGAAVANAPYDPARIDLSGVPGVTPQEQARAEHLVAITVARLPQWADPATALAAGYHSIGDGVTGTEHYINWSYVNDDKILNPDFPESLVYRVSGGTKTLVAAMYMLRPGSTLDDVPDIGGPLTQWHIHDNLCFTPDQQAPRVAGLTDANGNCRSPLVKLAPVPMIHVWIVPQVCGPFAALEGIGAGQIKPGQQRLCDTVHSNTL